jgi:hypothetical protein
VHDAGVDVVCWCSVRRWQVQCRRRVGVQCVRRWVRVSARVVGGESRGVDLCVWALQLGGRHVVYGVPCGLLRHNERPDDVCVLRAVWRGHILCRCGVIVLELQCRLRVSCGVDECDASGGGVRRWHVLANRRRCMPRLRGGSLRCDDCDVDGVMHGRVRCRVRMSGAIELVGATEREVWLGEVQFGW